MYPFAPRGPLNAPRNHLKKPRSRPSIWGENRTPCLPGKGQKQGLGFPIPGQFQRNYEYFRTQKRLGLGPEKEGVAPIATGNMGKMTPLGGLGRLDKSCPAPGQKYHPLDLTSTGHVVYSRSRTLRAGSMAPAWHIRGTWNASHQEQERLGYCTLIKLQFALVMGLKGGLAACRRSRRPGPHRFGSRKR
jgi:hypothetical protein